MNTAKQRALRPTTLGEGAWRSSRLTAIICASLLCMVQSGPAAECECANDKINATINVYKAVAKLTGLVLKVPGESPSDPEVDHSQFFNAGSKTGIFRVSVGETYLVQLSITEDKTDDPTEVCEKARAELIVTKGSCGGAELRVLQATSGQSVPYGEPVMSILATRNDNYEQDLCPIQPYIAGDPFIREFYLGYYRWDHSEEFIPADHPDFSEALSDAQTPSNYHSTEYLTDGALVHYRGPGHDEWETFDSRQIETPDDYDPARDDPYFYGWGEAMTEEITLAQQELIEGPESDPPLNASVKIVLWMPPTEDDHDDGGGVPSGPADVGGGDDWVPGDAPEAATTITFGLGRNATGHANGTFKFSSKLDAPNVLAAQNFKLLLPFDLPGETPSLTEQLDVSGIARRITGNGLVTEQINTDNQVTIVTRAIGAASEAPPIALHVLTKVAESSFNPPGLIYQQTFNGITKTWEYYGKTTSNGAVEWKQVLPDGSITRGLQLPWANGIGTIRTEEFVIVDNNEVLVSSEVTTFMEFPWGKEAVETAVKVDEQTNLITQHAYYTEGTEAVVGKTKWTINPDGSWVAYEYNSETGELFRTLRPWLSEIAHPNEATLQNSHAITYQRISDSESWEYESVKGTVISRNWRREWEDQVDPIASATRWNPAPPPSSGPPPMIWQADLSSSIPGLSGDVLSSPGYAYAVRYPDDVVPSSRVIFWSPTHSLSGHLGELEGGRFSAFDLATMKCRLSGEAIPVDFVVERGPPVVEDEFATVTIDCATAVEGDSLTLTYIGGASMTFTVGTEVASGAEPADVASTIYNLMMADGNSPFRYEVLDENDEPTGQFSSHFSIILQGSEIVLTALAAKPIYYFDANTTGNTFTPSTAHSEGVKGSVGPWEVVGSGTWSRISGVYLPSELNFLNGTFKINKTQRFTADYSLWEGRMELRDDSQVHHGYGDLRRVVDSSGLVMYYSYDRGTWDDQSRTFDWSPPPQGEEPGMALRIYERRFAVNPESFELVGEEPSIRVTENDYQGLTRNERMLHGSTPITHTVHDYDTATRERISSVQDGVTTYSVTQVNPTTREETDATGIVTRTIINETSGEVISTAKLGHNGAPDIVSTHEENGLTSISRVTAGSLKRVSSSTRDLAGRVVSSTDESGCTVLTTYAQGGRIVTETYPDGGTRITETYLDDKIKSVTGTAVVSEFHSYVVNTDGSTEHTVRLGAADSPRYTATTANGLGWFIKEERPSPAGGGALITTTHSYNTKGQRIKTATTGRVNELYSYDAFGRLVIQGLDFNNNGVLDSNLSEPITSTQITYEQVSGDWWEVITTIQTLNETNRDDFVSRIQRRKISASFNTLAYETGSDGTVTSTAVVSDPATKAVVTSVTSNRSSHTATRTIVNGLLSFETSLSGTGSTTYTYDALERLVEFTDPLGIVSKREYDDLGDGTARDRPKFEKLKPAGASEWTTTAAYVYYPDSAHANAGRLQQVTQRGGRTVIYQYDLRGRTTLQTGTAAYPIRYEYDVYGELWKMRSYRSGDPNGTADVATWEYDPASGTLLAKRDAKNRATEYVYHAGGQLLERRWARQMPNGSRVITTYDYDFAGRPTSVTYNDGTPAVATTYYADGQRRTLSDASGTHTFRYDGPGGVLSGEGISGGLLHGALIGQGFDDIGRRTALTWSFAGATRSTTYGYSVSGTLGAVSAFAQTVSYSHDPVSGRIEGVAYASGLAGIRAYDGEGRLESIAWQKGATAVSRHTYTHDTAGRRDTASRENGEVWGYTYNTRSEVTGGSKVAATQGNPAKPGHIFGYSYDGLGNRTVTSQHTPAGTISLLWGADETNALVSREIAPTGWVQGRASPEATVTVNAQAATRDTETGEFRAAIGADNPPAADWHPVNVQAVLSGAGKAGGDITVKRNGHLWFAGSPENFSYDWDGNLTSDGRWTYEWDGENRLIAMETAPWAVTAGVPATRLEFAYDAQSRRIRKRVIKEEGGNLVVKSDLRFLYDGWNLVAEVDFSASPLLSSPRLVRSYAWGLDLSNTEQGAGGVGGLLAVEHVRGPGRPDAVWLPCYDGNGDVSAYLDVDTGALEEQHDYDPFGNEVVGDFDRTLGGLSCPFRFSTKYTDDETGLCYYGLRYYSPQSGRWLSKDPIGENGGVNLYAFVSNAPTYAIDPLGLTIEVVDRNLEITSEGILNTMHAELLNENLGFNDGMVVPSVYRSLKQYVDTILKTPTVGFYFRTTIAEKTCYQVISLPKINIKVEQTARWVGGGLKIQNPNTPNQWTVVPHDVSEKTRRHELDHQKANRAFIDKVFGKFDKEVTNYRSAKFCTKETAVKAMKSDIRQFWVLTEQAYGDILGSRKQYHDRAGGATWSSDGYRWTGGAAEWADDWIQQMDARTNKDNFDNFRVKADCVNSVPN